MNSVDGMETFLRLDITEARLSGGFSITSLVSGSSIMSLFWEEHQDYSGSVCAVLVIWICVG